MEEIKLKTKEIIIDLGDSQQNKKNLSARGYQKRPIKSYGYQKPSEEDKDARILELERELSDLKYEFEEYKRTHSTETSNYEYNNLSIEIEELRSDSKELKDVKDKFDSLSDYYDFLNKD